MKKNYFCLVVLFVFSLLGIFACSKSNGSGPSEETLIVNTSPAINSQTESAALGPDFPLTVSIASKMPAQGVTIEVNAAQDGSSSSFFSETKNSTQPDNQFTITNTPSGVSCKVTVTVTSNTLSTNKKSGYYFYSRK